MQLTLDDEIWETADPGTEALVGRWLVDDGAVVEADQPIVEIVLMKAVCELRAPRRGSVRILLPADATFARGTPIAIIEDAGSTAEAASA